VIFFESKPRRDARYFYLPLSRDRELPDTLASAVSALADGWSAPKTQRALLMLSESLRDICDFHMKEPASDSSAQTIASCRNSDEAGAIVMELSVPGKGLIK
jgi:hypothetical protein